MQNDSIHNLVLSLDSVVLW